MFALQHTVEKQVAVSTERIDRDVIGIAKRNMRSGEVRAETIKTHFTGR